jgi:hypothetical protein
VCNATRREALPGIHHVTPFSKTAFCYFGEGGNLGKKDRFTKSVNGVISDPADASNEITLTTDPLDPSQARNNELFEYFEWLGAIREKVRARACVRACSLRAVLDNVCARAERAPLAQLRVTDALANPHFCNPTHVPLTNGSTSIISPANAR